MYGPEHGIRGAAQDGEHIAHSTDERTGVPTYSLYGQARAPDAAMLAGVELMLFDIQDVGARFLHLSLHHEPEHGRLRPSGHPLPRPRTAPTPLAAKPSAEIVSTRRLPLSSGQYPIPVRYGLTIGELARLFNEEYGIGADLHIVAMEGWQRSFYWDDTGLPWVPPSPNMPSPETAVIYPGTCFFEGTNVSEGRGTAKPFEQFGAPFIDGARLADALNSRALPGVGFRPTFFQPTASKYAGATCEGVQVHVLDRAAFEPVGAGFEGTRGRASALSERIRLARARRWHPQL